MFTFRRCERGEEKIEEDTEDAVNHHSMSSGCGPPHDEEQMGFIMFEAGLENVALKLVFFSALL